MNYAALVAAVSSYTENTFPTVDMNVFITQAEKRTYNKVQIPDLTDKHFNRLKASIAPWIGHHPCAKTFVILTTA